jgi:integrase
MSWERPRYRQQDSEIYVPDEKDLDQLIAATHSKRMAALLQCLKETFADPGEILRLEWKDIKDNVISINHPVKGHLSGKIEVSTRLIAMLEALPKTQNLSFLCPIIQQLRVFADLEKGWLLNFRILGCLTLVSSLSVISGEP